MTPAIGIDLGTTHSVVAVLEGSTPRVLVNAVGHTLVPSMLALDDTGHLLVGSAARERSMRGNTRVVSRFKPHMGDARTFALGKESFTATSLSALVLRELKEQAEEALGQSVTDVVVSVPAWFREPQRRATLDAGQLAGLRIQRIINEPTAAALAHGLQAGGEHAIVAVLDLGGGTFDVSILDMFDGVIEVLASVGDVNLGGEDVTDLIQQHLGGSVVTLPGTSDGAMRAQAERAKRSLSEREVATLDTPGGEVQITRAELDAWTEPLLQRMRQCIRESLVQAGLRPDQVQEVLPVGGATRMPAVRAMAETLFARPPRDGVDVDHVVALGAAVQAGLVQRSEALREIMVTDVLTHSLGVAVARRWGDQVYVDRFAPVLRRGTMLPASHVQTFHTTEPGQTGITVRVYEGEHRETRHNELLGTLEVADLPAHDDRVTTIEIRFSHDASGLLGVDVHVPETGARHGLTLTRGGVQLDEEDRQQAMARLSALRTHPRELLPNRFLLERATRIHRSVPADTAGALDDAILAFEAALDAGDNERIELRRQLLSTLLEGLSRHLHLDLLE